jgi:nucleoid-associated protein YgaU
MTRDAKLTLLAGLVFIVLVGYLLSNMGESRPSSTPEYFMAGAPAGQSESGGLDAGVRDVARFDQASTLQRELERSSSDDATPAGTWTASPSDSPRHQAMASVVRPVDDAAEQRSTLPRVELPGAQGASDESVEWLDATVAWSALKSFVGSAGEKANEAPVVEDVEEPALPETVVVAGRSGEHVVAKGDTLSTIAQEQLGSGSRAAVRRLMEANPEIKNPNVVPLGFVLKIPPAESGAIAAATAAEPASPKVVMHKVKPNDSLTRLARRFLGDEKAWREIYELNKASIKNPNVLLVGQTLKIPVRQSSVNNQS